MKIPNIRRSTFSRTLFLLSVAVIGLSSMLNPSVRGVAFLGINTLSQSLPLPQPPLQSPIMLPPMVGAPRPVIQSPSIARPAPVSTPSPSPNPNPSSTLTPAPATPSSTPSPSVSTPQPQQPTAGPAAPSLPTEQALSPQRNSISDYVQMFKSLMMGRPSAPSRGAPDTRPSPITACSALNGIAYGPMKHMVNEDGSTTHTIILGGGNIGTKGRNTALIFVTVQFLLTTAPDRPARGTLTVNGPNGFFLKFTLAGPPTTILPPSLNFQVTQVKGPESASFEDQKGTLTLVQGPVEREVDMWNLTIRGNCPRSVACNGPQLPGTVCAEGCGPPVVNLANPQPPALCQWILATNTVPDSRSHCGNRQIRVSEHMICPICLSSQTRIATPSGEMRVTDVTVGTIIWTQDADGKRIAAPVQIVSKTPVPSTHRIVHLALTDGRDVFVSPGHPTSDRRAVGDLHAGDLYDGSRVRSAELVSYGDSYTYDLLPEGTTGFYWADSILLGSTLR